MSGITYKTRMTKSWDSGDDAYAKKLQRIKVRSIKNHFQFTTTGSNTRWIFQPLKLILIIIALGILYTTLSRWLYGGSDLRYISNLDIDFEEISKALNHLPDDNKIKGVGLLNLDKNEIQKFQKLIPDANHTVLRLDYADKNLTWASLYPEWIDEEQDVEVPNCPSLPNLQIPKQRIDLIAVKLPCFNGNNWSRDIARLHLQIAAAKLATSCKGSYPVHLLFVTRCFPIPNLFTGKDLVAREQKTWLYKPNLSELRDKLRLPIGSCELALPLGGIEDGYSGKRQREAYATLLHSDYVYVCGAIAAAQSIRMSGSTRDLIILVDDSISNHDRTGLESAGWQVRTIQRIRNPKAEKGSYNEWNYSKFRLWQLTDYDKIIFIDSDLLILKNIDFLFRMPEISATGNDGPLFNSGVMVIEPSNCTFHLLMDHVNEIESYNGGDQGYLNEIFTWWHRIPKHINFLKHFWVGDDEIVRRKKTDLFGADPPVLYVIHYLGSKPWMCFRDYDCNWNVDILQEFASDAAHKRWWKVYDEMPERLKNHCGLKTLQKAQLEWDRRDAEKRNYTDGHWRIGIKDERLERCDENDCSWRGKLRHWVVRSAPRSATQTANATANLYQLM
ncbi:UDP-glucuronate:xylan alpha-glucuronosyltransferase 1 [Castilleja foliolosa]|uniref:Hexosyltransferase n=1 Tax=Castilleja foliolosa TaxID=1961234 RepID=A0ABD3BJP0_9LAMI